MSSQTAYILKAAELLYPGGLLAVIVPGSLFGESTPKIETRRIYEQFNHVVQVSLDSDAFAYLGVTNFPTKLLVLQRKAAAMADVPHDPEVAEQTSSEQIYFRYVYPAIDAARKVAPEIQLQINRTARKKDEVKKNEEALLYQIKAHPRTRGRYPECKQLLQEYYAQKRPDGLSDREWNEARLHYRPVVKQIRAVLQPHHLMFHQDKFPIQKIPLILYLRQLQNQVQKARHQ